MSPKIKRNNTKKAKLSNNTGVVHIQSTFNNTIVTITDMVGNTISWASAGSTGFKGARKGTPFAAQTASEAASLVALNLGLKKSRCPS
jgi:small subunit ribosomal protein S11